MNPISLTALAQQTGQPAAVMKQAGVPPAKTAAQTTATTEAPKGVAGGAKSSAGGGLFGLIPMIIVMAVLIYFMWRSQKKEQKKRQEMIESVKVGDRVVTIGGIYGEILTVREKSFILKIADNTRVEIAKNAVSSVPAGVEAPK